MLDFAEDSPVYMNGELANATLWIDGEAKSLVDKESGKGRKKKDLAEEVTLDRIEVERVINVNNN